MIDCSLSRYTSWPGNRTQKREGWVFQADYLTILEDRSAELRAVKAASVEVGMDLAERSLRNARRSFDGWPKADCAPCSPGVILRFDRDGKPMELACDRYANWKHNLRAISLTLKALRAVARYGATRRDQQYRGYERQIAAAPSDEETARGAAMLVAHRAGTDAIAPMLASRDSFAAALKQASANVIRQFGPDSQELRALNAACEVLKARHRGGMREA